MACGSYATELVNRTRSYSLRILCAPHSFSLKRFESVRSTPHQRATDAEHSGLHHTKSLKIPPHTRRAVPLPVWSPPLVYDTSSRQTPQGIRSVQVRLHWPRKPLNCNCDGGEQVNVYTLGNLRSTSLHRIRRGIRGAFRLTSSYPVSRSCLLCRLPKPKPWSEPRSSITFASQ